MARRRRRRFGLVIGPLGRVRADDDAWKSWEDEYAQTSDPRLLALAIGRNSSGPPPWALEACRELYAEHERAAPGKYKSDADDLEGMAELYVSREAETPHAAAQQVTGKETGHSDIMRLYRHWKMEERSGALAAHARQADRHYRCHRQGDRKIRRWKIRR